MSIKVKKFTARNMEIAEKLGKELLRLWVCDGYQRPFLEHSFIPYKGKDKESGVIIWAMQGSPIRGFVVVIPLGRIVRVFDSGFSEIFRIGEDYTPEEYQTKHYQLKGYSPKIKTYNPMFKGIR